jgi:hypothetical protein
MKPPRQFLPNPASNQPPVRLREDAEGMQAPSARWAVSVLQQARPYQPIPGRQERIWAGLQAAHRVSRAGRLRLAFAVALLLVSGLFGSAALAQWPAWLARVIHTAPTEARVRSPANRPPTSLAPAPMPPLVRQAASAPSAPAAEAPGAFAGSGHARRTSRPATPEESQILLDAMRALRVEQRPDRARAILAQYLARRPTGTLAEEALVMLVEAAVAHGDSDAPALAARYFTLYPKGGFADQVRRSLAGPPTGSR